MRVVGRPLPRNDALEKVTGRTRYVDDLGYEGMLHAATVRSPRPHIFIKKIDVRKAVRVPGFVRIVTAADVPGKNQLPLGLQDHPVLAESECRFHGEAIALVAGETPEAARRAARAVVVQHEELPFVTDPLESMKPDAPRVYGEDNCFRKFEIVRGDVDEAFASADVVVEGTYTTGHQCHAYLETQGVIAVPQADGGMLVEGSLQCPYYVHDAIARVLDVPSNRVRVVQCPTGGGFGGKEDMPSVVASHAAILARATGRPVKLVYERDEDFLAVSKRHPSWTHVRYAATRDGRLVAVDVKYVLDGGAYSTLSPIVLFRGTVHAAGPYRFDHVRVRSFAMATNKVPCGAFRGFGQPQVCFAQESLIDELARKVGKDPMELRRINLLGTGSRTITGQVIDSSCGMFEVIDRVKSASEWDSKRGRSSRQTGTLRHGIGMSALCYGVGLGAQGAAQDRAGAHVQIEKDGSVVLACGHAEIGQGAFTVLSQIAAEALGCPYESVRVLETDTTRLPDSGPTVASRTTMMSGNAVLDACRQLRSRIDRVAADLLGVAADRLTSDGVHFSADGRSVGYAELVAECWKRRVAMGQQGWSVSPPTSFDARGQGDAYVAYTFSANVAEVEVDTETGEVTVLRITSAHDLGRAINPRQAEAQIEGGIAQGVGYALYEDLRVEDGVVVNGHFTGYVVPTAADCPEYRTILIEKPFAPGPFGAKGLGEPPLIGVAPAIANAIADATGVRMVATPMTPEAVRKQIREQLGAKEGR